MSETLKIHTPDSIYEHRREWVNEKVKFLCSSLQRDLHEAMLNAPQAKYSFELETTHSHIYKWALKDIEQGVKKMFNDSYWNIDITFHDREGSGNDDSKTYAYKYLVAKISRMVSETPYR